MKEPTFKLLLPRCALCGKFIGSANPATVRKVVKADYWNGLCEQLVCQICLEPEREQNTCN